MTITARYPGRCAKCGGRINPGDKVNWDRNTKRVEHIECPVKYPDEAAEFAEAEEFYARNTRRNDRHALDADASYIVNRDNAKAARMAAEMRNAAEAERAAAHNAAEEPAPEGMIELVYNEGELLSGYRPQDEQAANYLNKLGLCQYLSGWGWMVDDGAAAQLGTEFTYVKAAEFVKTRR